MNTSLVSAMANRLRAGRCSNSHERIGSLARVHVGCLKYTIEYGYLEATEVDCRVAEAAAGAAREGTISDAKRRAMSR